jgi:hypothetical protein
MNRRSSISEPLPKSGESGADLDRERHRPAWVKEAVAREVSEVGGVEDRVIN